MHIRQARPDDLPAIAALEARGFPPAEAASPESFAARFAVFPHCFFVAEDAGVIVGHINGCMTDFTTCTIGAIEHISFDDNSATDSGSEGNQKQILTASSTAFPHFT